MNLYLRVIFVIVGIAAFFLGTACLTKSSAEAQNENHNVTASNSGERAENSEKSGLANSAPANISISKTPIPVVRKPANAVCPNPKKPCPHKQKAFDVWEISFGLPNRIVANKLYESTPFYAVVLRKIKEGCNELDYNSAVEPERLEIQKSYPTQKVFASYGCPNMDTVNYDFAGRRDKEDMDIFGDFIAVYAGETPDEADKTLKEALRKFPDAEIKKMTVSWSNIVQ